ncbi:hypothetical protein OHT17_50555 [Streptomyces sp. NBC_00371]|uniref:hypothetical protein n=1 Tax=Streptomyces sp. NBC_00371 TaxID=2975729 RepID=UPI002E255709
MIAQARACTCIQPLTPAYPRTLLDTALTQGWALAAWLRKNAGALDVQYVIWQGRIWSINHSHDEGGWGRPYDHGLNNPHTVTGGHYDHVHVTYKD